MPEAQISEIVPTLQLTCWALNCLGIFIIATTRFLWHTKRGWAWNGVLLLIIAVGNSVLLGSADLSPAQEAATIFSLVVLGSLGARFVGNWLTEGAT